MLSSRPVNAFGSTKTPGRGTFRSANHAENTIFPSVKRTVGKANTPFDSTSSTGSHAEEEDAISPLKQRAGSPIKQLQSTSFPTKSAQNKIPFHSNAGAGYRDVVFTKSPAKLVLHTPLPSVKKRFNYNSFAFNLATPALNLRPDSPLDEEQEQDSLSTPLPSSVRRMSRSSRMSMERSFQTPQNNGRHWDVSDISIELNDLQIDEEDPDAVTIDEDAEIEYMPPKVEVPYEPPFDFEFPDYKKVGSTFLRGYYMDPKEALAELPSFSEPFEAPQLEEIERLSSPSDTSEDSDDPFVQARRARAADAPKPKPTLKPTTAPGRPIPRSTSAAATRARPTSVVSSTTSRAASTTTTSRAASTTTTARSKPPPRPATAAAYVNSSRFTTTAAARPVAAVRSQPLGRAASSTSTPAAGVQKNTTAASTTRGKTGASAALGSQSQVRTVPSSSRSTSAAVPRPAASTTARGSAPKASIAGRRPTATQASASGAPATIRGRSMTTSSIPPRPTTAPGRVVAPVRVTSTTLKAGSKKPADKEYSDEVVQWAEGLVGSVDEDFLFDV